MEITPTHSPNLADRVDQSAALLFGQDSGTTLRLNKITSELRRDCERLRDSQSADITTISIVGRVGEGKSWLARAMLSDDPAYDQTRAMLPSGQNADDRTHELIWIGAKQPFAAMNHGERFVKVPDNALLDLGAPYALADSPGYSDHDPTLGALSSVALSSSPVKLLATSVSQIRDGSLAQFVASMNGSIIVPVIRFRPGNDQPSPAKDTVNDCQKEIDRWEELAPSSRIYPAIFLPDGGLVGDQKAREIARNHLADTLTKLLSESSALYQSLDIQLNERITFTQRELAAELGDFRARLGAPVDRLEQLTTSFPDIVEHGLVGEEALLRAAMRSRFRGDALERTSMLFFPFRSLLGILGLTLGAWDKVIFAAFGSVPSLIMSAVQSVKNVRETGRLESASSRLTDRTETLLRDAYAEDLRTFGDALASTTNQSKHTDDSVAGNISVQGIAALENESHEMITETVRTRRLSSVFLWLGGLIATLAFWGLLLGPLVSLYSAYFAGLHGIQESVAGEWQRFPMPPASLWITSLLLSLAPVFALAMITMYLVSAPWRVASAAGHIRQSIADAIHQRISNGKLRIEISNPRLEAARFLLSLGER